MVSEDKPLVPNEQDIKNKMEDVKELYRISDQAYGGFSEPGDGADRFSGRDPEPAPGNRLSPMVGKRASPRWILEVLADMVELAKNEQWSDLHASLQNAKLEVADALDQMDRREEATRSEPDGDESK